MKKGLSVASFHTDFGPIVYAAPTLTAFDQVCQKVKALGFDGLDLFLNHKEEADIQQLKQILDSHDLEVSMAIFIDLFRQGVNFSHQDAEQRAQSVDIYIREMDRAQGLGALSMPLGFIRGEKKPEEPYADYCERLAECTRVLAGEAKQRGIKLCLEPINRYEVNTILDVPSAVAFIADYGLEDTWLLPDLFHMNIEDTHMGRSLRAAGNRIGHMHVPDSNRLAPGLGHIDYDQVMQALVEVGYDGYLSAEAMSGGDPDSAARQAAQYLDALMARYAQG